MPEISRFFGIIIRIFYSDHAPPHFHHDYVLELTFSDGSSGRVGWRERLEKANPAGVSGPLRDPTFFAQVELWAEAGTIRWPNDADICPDVLSSEATGRPLPDFSELASVRTDS
jgi:hypothetical protein